MLAVKQGDLSLLQHPASQELLHSKIPARLAYISTDGTPRVIPIWFHWNGREIVMATPPKAPKLKALAKNPRVSLTIDDNTFPHKVLLIRGSARLEPVEGIVPEYEAAAARYFDAELGQRLAGAIAHSGLFDGTDYRHAGLGGAVRFSNPFPERACGVSLNDLPGPRATAAYGSGRLFNSGAS